MEIDAKINMTVLINTETKGKLSCKGLYALKNFQQKQELDIMIGDCDRGTISWKYTNPFGDNSC